MTTYAGLDLLLVAPNAVSSWGSSVAVPVDGFSTPIGNVVTTDANAPRTTAFTLTWNVENRADLATLETFLAARKGQYAACWIPTYQRELEYFGFDIVAANVFAPLFATTPHMRYWFARTAGGGQYRTRYWDGYTDLGNGTYQHSTSPGSGPTEIGTTTGSLASSAGVVWSRLMLCRMASDTYAVRYLGRASVVTADFVEVAGEL
jgi:hypothetical protein